MTGRDWFKVVSWMTWDVTMVLSLFGVTSYLVALGVEASALALMLFGMWCGIRWRS